MSGVCVTMVNHHVLFEIIRKLALCLPASDPSIFVSKCPLQLPVLEQVRPSNNMFYMEKEKQQTVEGGKNIMPSRGGLIIISHIIIYLPKMT